MSSEARRNRSKVSKLQENYTSLRPSSAAYLNYMDFARLIRDGVVKHISAVVSIPIEIGVCEKGGKEQRRREIG
jgi:hypothetical protein